MPQWILRDDTVVLHKAFQFVTTLWPTPTHYLEIICCPQEFCQVSIEIRWRTERKHDTLTIGYLQDHREKSYTEKKKRSKEITKGKLINNLEVLQKLLHPQCLLIFIFHTLIVSPLSFSVVLRRFLYSFNTLQFYPLAKLISSSTRRATTTNSFILVPLALLRTERQTKKRPSESRRSNQLSKHKLAMSPVQQRAIKSQSHSPRSIVSWCSNIRRRNTFSLSPCQSTGETLATHLTRISPSWKWCASMSISKPSTVVIKPCWWW